MWWIWGLFDDIATSRVDLVHGNWHSRRRRERVTVPDVMSMPFIHAFETLALAGLHVKVTRLEPRPSPEMGFVVGQYPPAGRLARRNARVRITVHHPPDPANAPSGYDDRSRRPRRRAPALVPDVRGLAFAEAWEKITLADFTVRVDRSRGDPSPVVGPVIAQSPPAGTIAPRWTQIRVRIAPPARPRRLCPGRASSARRRRPEAPSASRGPPPPHPRPSRSRGS